MKTAPISDFVKEYGKSGTVRMHMPGHKGKTLTGAEPLDITEIKGADYLFEAEGIIARSEELAAELYGSAKTLFSTEGSSLSIKGMLACARAYLGSGAKFAAPRNCHRAFINGCILLGIDPVWIYPEAPSSSVCTSAVTCGDIRRVLDADPAIKAVYLTSPDYPGNMADIRGAAGLCHERGVLLLTDNAHGAYLKFAGKGLHPLELGADMCCDSVHKTLPGLTGSSLLHISRAAPSVLAETAAAEMSLFASTSPSYVIMQSIERCISELSLGLADRIAEFCGEVAGIRSRLEASGYEMIGDEPMKLTVSPLSRGYTGGEIAEHLRRCGIEPEYSDYSCCVLMPTPYNSREDLLKAAESLEMLPAREPAERVWADTIRPYKALTPREAYLSPHETVPLREAAGRICARTVISCQPSVPMIVCGEIFDEKIIKFLENYSFFTADVVK